MCSRDDDPSQHVSEPGPLPWEHTVMVDWLDRISVRRATNEPQVRIDPANVHRIPWPWIRPFEDPS